jgi:hypothetical protein
MLDAFKGWAAETGMDEGKTDCRRLSALMRLKGFERKVVRWGRSKMTTVCYVGLHLKNNSELDDERQVGR